MKQYLFTLLTLLGISGSLYGQELISRKVACEFSGERESRRFDNEEIYSFPSTQDAENAANRILSEIFSDLKRMKIELRAADVDNAEAIIEGDTRMVLYNVAFMLKADQNGDWASIFVLAHEIGHHVLGHTLLAGGSRPKEELNADEWAGAIMCKLGANLDQAQTGIKTLVKDGPKPAGSTHPPKSARLQAVALGFANAKCKAGGNTDKDSDNDGVADKDDKCPNEYANTRDGCPQKKDLPDNMIFVQGGTFQMGSNDSEAGSDEKPVHSVTLSDFYMGKYEVTNEEYCGFLNAKGNQTEGGREWIDLSDGHRIYKSGSSFVVKSGYARHPVSYVSWYGAVAYCNWLSKTLGKTYSLPTEAQWEYAARSKGKSNKYAWGNSTNPTNGANVCDESTKSAWNSDGRYIFSGYTDNYAYTCPVERSGANEIGLYGMTGNVCEWCADWYSSDYYGKSPTSNPTGATNDSIRVLRGGSWGDDPPTSRCADRHNYDPSTRFFDIGFRIVALP